MNDIAMTTKEKDYPYYCRICGEAIADSEATHDRVCPMCENERQQQRTRALMTDNGKWPLSLFRTFGK